MKAKMKSGPVKVVKAAKPVKGDSRSKSKMAPIAPQKPCGKAHG